MDKSLYPCTNCGKNHAPQRCPCYRASYCGPTCQKAHWGEHKGVCTVFLSRETKEQKSKHGTDSSESLEAQYKLALQYCDDRNDDKAEKTFRKYLDILDRIQLKKNFKPNLWHIMHVHYGIAGIYRDRVGTDIARVHFNKSLTICRQYFPGEYDMIESLNTEIRRQCNGNRSVDEIIRSMGKLSDNEHDRLAYRNQEMCMAYAENGEIDIAITTGKKALEHVRKTTDRECEGSILILLADILCSQGRFDEALPFIEESLPIMRRCMGDKGFGVGNALMILSRIYEGQSKDDDALKMNKKALRYLRRSAGDKHMYTLMAAKQLISYYFRHDMVTEILEMLEKEEDFTRLTLLDDYEWMLARVKGTIKDRAEVWAGYHALVSGE